MRKIGTFTPIWNQEPFIIPHFNMISSLDRNLVFMGDEPLLQYREEHGYSTIPDRSEELLRKNFPNVEIRKGTYKGNFGAGIYNEGLEVMQDMDIVFRLDPDMFFTKKDWKQLIDFIRNTDYDCYRMNFSRNSINYYKDFDHGLKDAREFDPLAVDPKKPFEEVLNYPAQNPYTIEWEGWLCHHFRGWNKPKSITKDWENTEYAKEAFVTYSNNGAWYKCPQEIREMFDEETTDTWLGRVT